MTYDKRAVQKILDQSLTAYRDPLQEDVRSAVDRVWESLQSNSASTLKYETLQVRPARASSGKWHGQIAAAMAVVAVLAVAFTLHLQKNKSDARAIVETGDGQLLFAGKRIYPGESVRTGNKSAVLTLADGSRVEMRSMSELSLERADDGVRIRLNNGDVIVNAAKQHGHLYVQTKDVTVSVVGTVFLVKSEEEGSRVAVIQGEVRVQQLGVRETKLLPGDQFMTKPLMEWRPVSEEFSWSQNKETHLALLQQSVVVPAEPREEFEVVSVRPSVVTVPRDGRGGGGVFVRNPRSPIEPCSRSSEPVVDPRRFDTANTTLYNLVTWAYGLDCRVHLGGSDFVFGGPAWIKADGFDIQTVIPEGSPSYTADQFRAHNAPKLQMMVQSMLENRFSLMVHREMKEMQVYVLTVAKGGPKFITGPVSPNPESPTGAGSGGTLNVGLQSWKDGDNPCCHFMFDGTIWDQKETMAHLAAELGVVLGQPVLDRTGLTGEFNYLLRFQPRNMPTPDSLDLEAIERTLRFHFPAPGTRSISAALEQDFGLHLEATKEKLEVLVIDHVEKPSEN